MRPHGTYCGMIGRVFGTTVKSVWDTEGKDQSEVGKGRIPWVILWIKNSWLSGEQSVKFVHAGNKNLQGHFGLTFGSDYGM